MNINFSNRLLKSTNLAMLCEPTKVSQPSIIHLNKALCAEIFGSNFSENFSFDQNLIDAEILCGNSLLKHSTPYATVYGGHQFGNWAGQLGDGRAIFLGEIQRQQKHFELQLKGAGPTPFSRRGDGRAVLRSSMREYICAEAMFHLGIPTTRSLSLCFTGDSVVRDILYSGNPKSEPGAIVCRVAESFLRFGHFEFLAAQEDIKELKNLMFFTIKNYFSHLVSQNHTIEEIKEFQFLEMALNWYGEVVSKTATLAAQWMSVGFVHGVLNTDNMSILGLTIDYGPYGWLEEFDPLFTPNTTDTAGKRYAYAKQPQIMKWNLAALGNALIALGASETQVLERLDSYDEIYLLNYRTLFAKKLSFEKLSANNTNDFGKILSELFRWMTLAKIDFTNFFLAFSEFRNSGENTSTNVSLAILENKKKSFSYSEEDWQAQMGLLNQFLENYKNFTQANDSVGCLGILSDDQTKNANPQFVPRNFLLFEAIEEQEKNLTQTSEKFSELWKHIQNPFEILPSEHKLKQKMPHWAKDKPGSSVLSCSS